MGGRQAGFVHSAVMDLMFLLVMILLAIGVWNWFSTLIGGDFMLAWFMVWLMAAATAWWFSKDQLLILRVPAGMLAFAAAAVLLMPLSWWPENKLITGTEAAVAAALAPHLGKVWSRRLGSKLQPAPPWYLNQSINLINDLFRWAAVCAVAWFVVGVLPLMLVFVMPVEWLPWAALAWAFLSMAWFLTSRHHHSRVRILKLPLGLWVMAAAVPMLGLLQQRIIGTLDAGSVGMLGYWVYLPASAALAVEIVLVGMPAGAAHRIMPPRPAGSAGG